MAKNETYEEFISKFNAEQPKTTDDCYTPRDFWECILNWAINEYGLHDRAIVRPFYPGGDYENHFYPENCVVIDNPPFSILSKIVRFYESKEIDYFLFAPTLTLFSIGGGKSKYLVCDSYITYKNGARVRTSFVTSLEKTKIRLAGDLSRAINHLEKQRMGDKKKLGKYVYPKNVVSAAIISNGVSGLEEDVCIQEESCHFIRKVDGSSKNIFGAAFLVSEKVKEVLESARELARESARELARESARESARKVLFSEREQKIVEGLR